LELSFVNTESADQLVVSNGHTQAPSCLVVEDEPAIQRIVEYTLRGMGCVVHAVSSAEDALRLIRQSGVSPDITITDIRLPGIDGVELARMLKSDPRLGGRPVLLMSAYGEPRDHPGDAFLPKPFDIDQLSDFVGRYIDVPAD
jgi:two-component system phosphate regulon response regulator PhoB